MSYSCTIGRDGRLYVFKSEKGSKVRVKNIYANKCPSGQLKECKKLCNKKSPHRKANPPCSKKNTVFTNNKEIKDYCKSKVKGSYSRKDRAKIAAKANLKLLKNKRNSELKQTITFAT